MKDVKEDENKVIARSKDDFEREWAWLFRGLPMKHRARLVNDRGIYWLEVSFIDRHKKAWNKEKYLLRDLLRHQVDYIQAIDIQCTQAIKLMKAVRK